MSPTRAAGMPPISTVGQPGGRIGPPTCGTTPGDHRAGVHVADAGCGWHGAPLSPLQTMVATVPPSTDQLAPVTSAARSEQRKTTTPAISSGVPKRPSVVLPAWTSIDSSRESRAPVRSGPRARPRPSTARGDGPGRDRVDEHALGAVAVGEHARERGLGGLGHRVGGVGERRALAGRRGDVDHPAPAALGHRRRERAHQPHRGHHVQLPLQLPVLLAQLAERLAKLVPALLTRMSGRRRRAAEDLLGRVERGHVDPPRARHRQRARALLAEEPHGLRADAAPAAGHDRDAARQSQVHPCMMPG